MITSNKTMQLSKLLRLENVLINSREQSSLVETSHQNLAKKIDTKDQKYCSEKPPQRSQDPRVELVQYWLLCTLALEGDGGYASCTGV